MASTPAFGNVFVTGATGLLGSELVAQLLANHECRKLVVLVRDQIPQSRFFREKMHEKCIVIGGDLRDQALLDRTLNEYEIETVFHLAAQTIVGHANNRPTETFDVNIRGTWALLEAVRMNARTVKRTVIASSDKAYGNLKGEEYDENFPLAGAHPYDVSKSCTDLLSHSYAHSYGMNVCITRCGNFFGPGDLNESRIIPHTVLSILRGETPVIRSDGTFIRDYIYVGDGAGAYRTLAHKMKDDKLKGEAFNFSYGLKMNVIEVVETLSKVMKASVKPKILGEARNEIPVQRLNSDKARKILSWKPDYGFEKGLERTVAWYKAAHEAGAI